MCTKVRKINLFPVCSGVFSLLRPVSRFRLPPSGTSFAVSVSGACAASVRRVVAGSDSAASDGRGRCADAAARCGEARPVCPGRFRVQEVRILLRGPVLPEPKRPDRESPRRPARGAAAGRRGVRHIRPRGGGAFSLRSRSGTFCGSPEKNGPLRRVQSSLHVGRRSDKARVFSGVAAPPGGRTERPGQNF